MTQPSGKSDSSTPMTGVFTVHNDPSSPLSNTSIINNTSTNTGNSARPSKNQIVKQGWGNRQNFQYSYGLGVDPEGIEEGNAILEGLMALDAEKYTTS
ncbi:MAG: hypothetical protein M1836_003967 [Candelina mexicana]|nr:MAG: hypothetical protein M1836_003967 [Candelina mexicana]